MTLTQPGYADEHEVRAPRVVRLLAWEYLEREPQVGTRGEVEPLRHHPDDLHRHARDPQGAADDPAIGAEAALPQAVRDQRPTGRAGDVLLRPRLPAERRRHPESGQKALGRLHRLQPLGPFTAHVDVDLPVDGDVLA
ncbi:MAG TPA: hypothetical protein VMT16_08705 [Thermoanaerobaculia bacterium]|nr:hypothetical protein [Thermoanaerobaculia bacterium]